jgi:DNA primase
MSDPIAKTQLEEITTLVDICHANLRSSNECLKYLIRDRGLSKDLIRSNKIGYFPQNIGALTKHVSDETLSRLNILNMTRGSDFSNYFYLIFPIFSEHGDPIGISGRTLLSDEDRRSIGIPKYKNSSYKKGNILYGLNHAKESIIKNNNVYVIEGYFDYLSMVQNELDNSVAICGTAFSQNHFLKLARYTDKITFVLDGDEAGLASAKRIYNKYINKGIKFRFLIPPSNSKDIDEYFSLPNKNRDSFFKDFKQSIPEFW